MAGALAAIALPGGRAGAALVATFLVLPLHAARAGREFAGAAATHFGALAGEV